MYNSKLFLIEWPVPSFGCPPHSLAQHVLAQSKNLTFVWIDFFLLLCVSIQVDVSN